MNVGARKAIPWLAIEREYVRAEVDVSMHSLADKYGSSHRQIERKCAVGNWTEKRRKWRERLQGADDAAGLSVVAAVSIDYAERIVEARERYAKVFRERFKQIDAAFKAKGSALDHQEASQYLSALSRAAEAERSALEWEPVKHGIEPGAGDDGATADDICQRVLDAAAKLPGDGDPGAASG